MKNYRALKRWRENQLNLEHGTENRKIRKRAKYKNDLAKKKQLMDIDPITGLLRLTI